MGHKHTREQLLAGAIAAAQADGLSQLTFGRLARRLGISDRIVVYYFPTKDDLIGAVLGALGDQLRVVLASAFHTRAADHVALARAAWPALARVEVDPVFRLWFEASGLAVAGREPFRTITGTMLEGWVDWLAGFLDGPPGHRRGQAEAATALVDGLLLVRLIAGPAAAERAADELGLR